MTTYIKYFGIERSCSNVTERYILDTYKDTYSAHAVAWKHGPPNVKQWAEKNLHEAIQEAEDEQEKGMYEAVMNEEIHYIICTKNPFAWLHSYIEGLKNGEVLPSHYQRHDDMMQDVIDMDRKYMHHLDDPSFWKLFLNKYNVRHQQWWEFAEERWSRSMIMRHEDLLINFREEIERIGRNFDLEKKGDIDRVKKEIGCTCEEKENNFDMAYYIEEKYMDDLSEEQKRVVSKQIDWNFLSEAPYNYSDKYRSSV